MSASDGSSGHDGGDAPRQSTARFPRQSRLTTGADFSRVFRRASRRADDYFTVLARLRDEDGARLGMAISRRSAKSAVARNRIKRLIRESFRHACDRLPCADIVVISRPPAAEASNKTLTRSLETHWRRLRSRRRAEG
ncbi:ribonuclease P protein component [Lentisalinibacter sediminis]|uniref:ribonuclease P protein component n=1 Tax=Lentisalinibacter sediminis TaxID=2992237 RepID=UPI00386439C7